MCYLFLNIKPKYKTFLYSKFWKSVALQHDWKIQFENIVPCNVNLDFVWLTEQAHGSWPKGMSLHKAKTNKTYYGLILSVTQEIKFMA